jgi:hypothetical protein
MDPKPKAQTPSSFCSNLMALVRLFYPIGVNVLNPQLNEQAHSALDHKSGIFFKTTRGEKIVIKPCSSIEKREYQALFSLSLSSPYKTKVERIFIKANEQILIGRTHLYIRDLMGFPFCYQSIVSLEIDDPTWSRASLQLVCTANGQLYLYDRASRNPFQFQLLDFQNQHTHSLIYDPSIEASTPLNKNDRNSLSLSIGSISSVNQSQFFPNEVLAALELAKPSSNDDSNSEN